MQLQTRTTYDSWLPAARLHLRQRLAELAAAPKPVAAIPVQDDPDRFRRAEEFRARVRALQGAPKTAETPHDGRPETSAVVKVAEARAAAFEAGKASHAGQ